MRKNLPHTLLLLFITGLFWSAILTPVQSAPPPGWSGDDDFAFLLEINGVSAADSNSSNPILLDPSGNITIGLTIDISSDLFIHSGSFVMSYLSIPIISQVFPISQFYSANTTDSLINATIPLSDLLGAGGISLISGTVTGSFTFIYDLASSPPGTNVTIPEDFVLQIGPTGAAAIMSVSGLITIGFTAMAVFSLLLALDDFQQGILTARKMRGAKRGSDVGIFPRAVVLRRKPKKKKDQERIDKDELKKRVAAAASSAWTGKRCPKCGKKWKKDADQCQKCKIERKAAVVFFSVDIAEYAPKALKVVKPKSKIAVGAFSKKLRLKPNKGGALAAALVDMGILQTKSVKVPLMKVAMVGTTLSGTYWSWLQMLSGAVPSLIDILLTATIGLVVSVLIAYFMKWLARVPKLGYD